ncbi:MAG: Type pilus assembly protein PilM [Cyanobacteriota bacterium erpe_2018_sw_21hr_WHONDRS-SW48-000092_B_bin.40]|nr:Type pilus assembly protein PilM [Cyanobacteriota bacterium erpe_2018_sw_21hr_WHONDRS-SW48-000092_B_bin.40]
MFSFGKKKGAMLGLDINSDSTTLVQLDKTKSGIEVQRFACQPTPPNCIREGLITDPVTMGQLVDDLLKEAQIPTNQAPIINVSVPAQAVVIRLMPVPVGMPPEELADVVTQEATNHVPFPITEANLDWCQMNATERTDPDGVRRVDVILSAIQHSIVESYWRMADVAGVKLGRVEVSSLSVIRGLALAGYLGSSGHLSLVVNIRQDATDINIVRSAMPLFGRSIILGVEALTEAIARSLDLSFDQAMEILPDVPVFNITPADARLGQAGQVARTIFSDIGDELNKSVEFYRSQVGDVKIDQVILTGPGCMMPNIDEYFTSKLRIKTILGDPMRDMLVDESRVSPRMRPILAALIGSSIEPTWNPSITVDLDLNKEGRLPLALDLTRTQNILDEPPPTPGWFKPTLIYSFSVLLLSLASWMYFANFDVPQAQKEIEVTNALITDGNRKLADLKRLRQDNEVLERRKQVLDRLVGGGKHWSGYLEAVRDNTPKGLQINQLSLNDSELKLEGAALDFSTVSNLSINLGSSNLLSDANIEYALRPDKNPDRVTFCVLSKLAQDKVTVPGTNIIEKPNTATVRPSSLISSKNTISTIEVSQ